MYTYKYAIVKSQLYYKIKTLGFSYHTFCLQSHLEGWFILGHPGCNHQENKEILYIYYIYVYALKKKKKKKYTHTYKSPLS